MTPDQSGSGSNGNREVLHNSRILMGIRPSSLEDTRSVENHKF